MKVNLLIVLVSSIVLASCVKENTPEIPLNDTVDTTMAMSGERNVHRWALWIGIGHGYGLYERW